MARHAEGERGGLPILHFADAAALEAWLKSQSVEHKGIWLKVAKNDRGVTSSSVAQAIDAGLSFGWIDGLQGPQVALAAASRTIPKLRVPCEAKWFRSD